MKYRVPNQSVGINSILFYIESSPSESESSSDVCNGCKTVTSTIEFRPTAQDNQASFGCKAVHPALKLYSPLRAKGTAVILSVLCKYMIPHHNAHV